MHRTHQVLMALFTAWRADVVKLEILSRLQMITDLNRFGSLVDHVAVEYEDIRSLLIVALVQQCSELVTASMYISNHDDSSISQLFG